MPAEPVELFIGQMIALLPKLHQRDADQVQRMQVQRLFPRLSGAPVPHSTGPRRPRSYSLIINSRGGGTLSVGGTEIPVAIMELDLETPPEATAFRVAAIAGRAVRVRGIAEGDDLDDSPAPA